MISIPSCFFTAIKDDIEGTANSWSAMSVVLTKNYDPVILSPNQGSHKRAKSATFELWFYMMYGAEYCSTHCSSQVKMLLWPGANISVHLEFLRTENYAAYRTNPRNSNKANELEAPLEVLAGNICGISGSM